MDDSVDIFQVGSFNRFFTIRWYRERAAFPIRKEPDAPIEGFRHWGKRDLGGTRFALEFYHLSLVFENYNPPKEKK